MASKAKGKEMGSSFTVDVSRKYVQHRATNPLQQGEKNWQGRNKRAVDYVELEWEMAL